jgi:transcriptional regulator with XRE-family HTH domain
MGLSRARLALLLGVTANTVARWERGTLRIANPTLVRLALERLEGRPSQTGAPALHDSQLAPPRHNLPAALTSLVGRRAEIRKVRQLCTTHRFVTLTGAAGIGKTRLAVEVARQLVPRFPGGAWLVDLAPLADAGLLAETVAAGLRVPLQAGRPVLEALVEQLRDSGWCSPVEPFSATWPISWPSWGSRRGRRSRYGS